MKIYTKVVIDMKTGHVVESDSLEYDGPIAKCNGGGGGGGGYDDDEYNYDLGNTTSEAFDAAYGTGSNEPITGTFSDVENQEFFDASVAENQATTTNFADSEAYQSEVDQLFGVRSVDSDPVSDEVDYSTLFEGGAIGQEVLDTSTDVQAGIDSTLTPKESLDVKAKDVLFKSLKEGKLSPLKTVTSYLKNAYDVELTPAEQAIYDADIAEANEQLGGYGDPLTGTGDALGGGTTPTNTDPATSGDTKRRGDVDAGPGEGETPEEIERKARERKGFTQNLFTGARGLVGKANTRRRYLFRGGR